MCCSVDKNLIGLQIDEIWMEFCCEEKFTAKQEFVETETRKYEFEEETEIVEDFGKVSQKLNSKLTCIELLLRDLTTTLFSQICCYCVLGFKSFHYCLNMGIDVISNI